MSGQAIEVEREANVARVWIARPEIHNALSPELIGQLIQAFIDLNRQNDIRVIVLSGRGRSFSAGAQLQWMQQQGAASQEENAADARRLAELFRVIAASSQPTIARVQGAAIGGGLGLVAACDIAIAANTAVFATSEVRLGLIPATIAPYVVRAIGERNARRYFQTGERIDASTAERIGLLHESVAVEDLDARVNTVIGALLAGAPQAQAAAKALVRDVTGRPVTAALIEDTAQRIASCRALPEAQEGLSAFLEKRPASWVPEA